MQIFLLWSAISAAPVEKNMQFGTVSIQLRQSVEKAGGLTEAKCEIVTVVAGQKTSKKYVYSTQLKGEVEGCFSLPRSQEMPGFFMLRRVMVGLPHTLLISEQGDVFDVEDMVARSGRWETLQAQATN